MDQNPPSDDGKKGFVWVLEQSALEKGVESTTRYRKLGSNKKSGRVEPVAAQRQRSGAKGGKAAKKSAKLRRTTRSEQSQRMEVVKEASQDPMPANMRYREHHCLLDHDPYDTNPLPYPVHTPPLTVHSSNAGTSPYGFEDISGCVPNLDSEPLFYDSSEQDGMDQTLSTPHQLFCDGEFYPLRGCEFDLSTLKDWH